MTAYSRLTGITGTLPRVNTSSWQAKGLMAWYPVVPGAATGRRLFDASGHGKHGLFEASNFPVWEPDASQYALRFGIGGSRDEILIPNPLGIFSTGTLWMWLRNNANSTSGAPAMMSAAGDASHYPFGAGGDVYMSIFTDARIGPLDDGTFDEDKWHSFCCRTSPGSGGYQFWQGKTMLGSGTGASSLNISASNWIFGYWNSGQTWPGYIAEARIYNRALSSAEIIELSHPNARFDLWQPAVNRTWFLGAAGAGASGGMRSQVIVIG